MNIQTQLVQISNQPDWTLYSLTNDSGMVVEFLNYGGIITKVLAPDKSGKLENIVLGFEDYEDYVQNPPFFGAIIGRVAGRIQGASFTLNGQNYSLPANDGPNHLHGGPEGFHQALWKGEPFETASTVGVKLFLNSPDGAGGYPGALDLTVTYTLTNDNQFEINYEAVSDQDTVLTLTNHTYFNLSGNLKEKVSDHQILMSASHFLELDDALIPTGQLLNVEETPFDFRSGRRLKEGFTSDHPQNKVASNGYDHYFIFDQTSGAQIQVEEPSSGRKLSVQTEQPGVVLYTSNMLGDNLKLNEGPSGQYLGFCLETQSSPASLHHNQFPSILLKKGEAYSKKTIFSFETI